MSTTVSSASPKPTKKTNKVTEIIMTGFAILFTLSPIAAMAILATQFIDFSGAGDLAQEITASVFGAKER